MHSGAGEGAHEGMGESGSAVGRLLPASHSPACRPCPVPCVPRCMLQATVPPGASLLSVFKQQGGYVVPGHTLEELAAEGPEARRARWEHLPAEVLQRQPPWMV